MTPDVKREAVKSYARASMTDDKDVSMGFIAVHYVIGAEDGKPYFVYDDHMTDSLMTQRLGMLTWAEHRVLHTG